MDKPKLNRNDKSPNKAAATTAASPTKAVITAPESDKSPTKPASKDSSGKSSGKAPTKTTLKTSKAASNNSSGKASTRAASNDSSGKAPTKTATKNASKESSGTSQEDNNITREEDSMETESGPNEGTESDTGAESSETRGEPSAELSDTQEENSAVNDDSKKGEPKAVNKKKGRGAVNIDHNEKSKEDDTSQDIDQSETQQKEDETEKKLDNENESNLEKDTAITSHDEPSNSLSENVDKENAVEGAEDSVSMEVDESVGESETKNSESEKENNSHIEKDSAEKNMEVAVNETESTETEPVDNTEKEPGDVEDHSTDLETNIQEESRMETDTENELGDVEKLSTDETNIENEPGDVENRSTDIETNVQEESRMETNIENEPGDVENHSTDLETNVQEDSIIETNIETEMGEVENCSTDLETNALEDSGLDTDNKEKEKEKSEDGNNEKEKDKAEDDSDEKEKDKSEDGTAIPKKESGEDEDDEIMEVPVVKKPAPIVDLVDDDEEAKKDNKNEKSSGTSSNDDSQTNDNSGDGLCNNVSESRVGDIVENAGDIIGADDMLGLRISSVVGGEDCITGIAMDEENCHEHDAIQDIQIESVMTLQQPSSPQDPSAMDQDDETEKDEDSEKISESEKRQENEESEKEKDDTEIDKEKTIEDTEKDENEKDETEKDKEKEKSTETASTKEGEKESIAEAEGGEKNSDDGGGGLQIVSLTTLADKEQDKDTDAAQESSEPPVEKTTDTTTTTTTTTSTSAPKTAPKIRLSSAVSAVATESDVYFVLRSAVMMPKTCEACKKETQCQFRITKRGEAEVLGYLCSQECKTKWCAELPPNKSVGKARLIFEKCCGMCGREMNAQTLADQYAWETRDFCSAKCVENHLVSVASKCHQCLTTVSRPFVGKYCVRFGSDIHQFCTNSCLEKYKTNIKVCCYCQKNLSSSTATNVVSPTSNKEYCSTKCLKRNQRRDIGQQNYSEKKNCTVCQNNNINRYEFILNGEMTQLCSDPCLNVYKYANKVKAVPCCLCQRLMNAEDVAHFIFHDGRLLRVFCTDSCLNTFILSARKIKVCASCKVKKYNFDMVSKHREEGQEDQHFCSLNCLSIGEGRSSMIHSSSNGTSSSSASGGINSNSQTGSGNSGSEDTLSNCNMCSRIAKAQYHMVMSDNSLRNFCSYDCATKYKSTYGFLVTGASKSSSTSSTSTTTTTAGKASDSSKNNLSPTDAMKAAQDLLSLLNPPVMVNKMTWCRPQQVTKGVYCKPHPWHKSSQTDPEDDKPPPIIPVPLPIYVPAPMMMYNAPLPVPIFVPLPIPVPIFIPTTAQTTQGIKEAMEKIKEELPDDPFEAEMLLLARRTAEEAAESSALETPKEDSTKSLSGQAGNVSSSSGFNMGGSNSTPNMQQHHDTNDQDAYTALSHLESCLEASMEDNGEDEMDETDAASLNLLEEELPRFPFRLTDGSGKRYRGSGGSRGRKRRRLGSDDDDPDDPDYGQDMQDEEYSDPENYYHEKDPDQYEGPFLNSNYGLAAWKHWVQRKNSELSRLSSASRPMKLFKEDLLSLNCDELNNALCIFLKDLRKPSGEEFQGDTVFYLLLGIQQYLFACTRTDCIFMDFGFERFTTGLDDICKRFLEELAADSLAGSGNMFGTRITEDMLWESRQLGAHTPQVLLNTLFYFNTKVFRLKTVEEHVAISFVQIVKQWKRANVGREGQVTRMTLLRYFPKKSANTGKPADWQGYYMYENKEDPLRCPVKLYEFYLSKCPESVRNTRNIYYVYPERSCVPDSPVWFSTQPLHPETLSKMLNRALMVREVQEAHSLP